MGKIDNKMPLVYISKTGKIKQYCLGMNTLDRKTTKQSKNMNIVKSE